MSNKDYVEPLGRAFLRVLFIGCFEIGSPTAWVARPGAERLGPAVRRCLQCCSVAAAGRDSAVMLRGRSNGMLLQPGAGAGPQQSQASLESNLEFLASYCGCGGQQAGVGWQRSRDAQPPSQPSRTAAIVSVLRVGRHCPPPVEPVWQPAGPGRGWPGPAVSATCRPGHPAPGTKLVSLIKSIERPPTAIYYTFLAHIPRLFHHFNHNSLAGRGWAAARPVAHVHQTGGAGHPAAVPRLPRNPHHHPAAHHPGPGRAFPVVQPLPGQGAGREASWPGIAAAARRREGRAGRPALPTP